VVLDEVEHHLNWRHPEVVRTKEQHRQP
jgi:hypothetical protein